MSKTSPWWLSEINLKVESLLRQLYLSEAFQHPLVYEHDTTLHLTPHQTLYTVAVGGGGGGGAYAGAGSGSLVEGKLIVPGNGLLKLSVGDGGLGSNGLWYSTTGGATTISTANGLALARAAGGGSPLGEHGGAGWGGGGAADGRGGAGGAGGESDWFTGGPTTGPPLSSHAGE